MNGTRLGKAALAAAIALGLGSTGAAAQEGGDRATFLVNAARAAEEAASHSQTTEAKNEAIRLHLEIASLPEVDDAQAVASLRTAALYMAYSKPRHAARLMEQAAERASAHGNVLAAAESYLDAASTLARDDRLAPEDFTKISSWLGQARDLAESPLLTTAQKDRIIHRAGPTPGQFAG